jgi:hypothetical protein
MTKYLKSLAGLSSAPEALVQMSIAGTIITVQLAEVPQVLAENGWENNLPRDVTCNGVKTGVFPVIEPKTQDAALALSAVMGYPVPVGDGVRFCTQRQARDILRVLKKLGTNLDDLVREWQMGKPQGATAQDLVTAPKPRPTPTNELAGEVFPM